MINNNFNFELVTNVLSGADSINNVYKFLQEKDYKKVGLILDKKLYENSRYIKFFLTQFKKKKILKKIYYFSGIEEPTYQHLDLVTNQFKKKRIS
tara:strand:+ start:729 stop:1013 length:285 start_codon:yes stop_codon:yes gene_type:complete